MKDFSFQGNLKKCKYFEGWYYKNTTIDKECSISIIPGISLNKDDSHAFIQVIETKNQKSYYFRYSLDLVSFNKNPFCIKIDNNFFYDDYIDLNIKNNKLELSGFLYYSDITPIKKSLYSPTIMGPFSYFKMQCNHSIHSLHHYIDGILYLNGEIIDFEDGIGYIEKDYGTSFPSDYLWIQSNHLTNPIYNSKKISLFFSLANIPVLFSHFKGFIAIILIDSKEYKFTSYNASKLNIIDLKEGKYKFVLKKGINRLVIEVEPKTQIPLIAPSKGEMVDEVYESLDSVCHVKLYKRNKIIFKEDMCSVGYEKNN